MIGNKILPEYVNVDLHPSLMPQDACLFLKNLVYSLDDTSNATADKGSKTGTYKTMQSTALYVEDLVLPAGVNTVFSARSCKELRSAFVFVHNSLGNHTIYRLNGADATYDIVKQGAVLNFQLQPQYFIHQGGFAVIVTYVTDPATGEQKLRTFMEYTDGYNYQRFICVEDAIATNGFDPVKFPYFQGDYDPMLLINMGVPTPMDCIEIDEVPLPEDQLTVANDLLYQTWQFRVRWYDVWGRPSEYGRISDLYVPGVSDCVKTVSGLPRCLNLTFDAPPPHINQVEIAYRNCNDNNWKVSDTLYLYNGSQLGEWWLRQRNPKVNYNGQTKKITYQFCAHKDCRPIDPADTSRLYNPLPRTSQALSVINNVTALGNNKDGFLPFSQDLLDKITVTVEPPDPATNGNDFVNIDVYVAIYNPFFKANEPIYITGVGDASHPAYGWGALTTGVQYRAFFAYLQYFINSANPTAINSAERQIGFVGYLAGTPYYVTSKQYFLSTTGALTPITDFSLSALYPYYGLPTSFQPNPISGMSHIPLGTFLQKFSFTNVPKGKYIFRIANHQIDPLTNPTYQQTSTYVIGSSPFNSGLHINPINYSVISSQAKEVVIDACKQNYDGLQDNNILIISDLCYGGSDVEQGYVLNTNIAGESQHGVELLQYNGGELNAKTYFTDHNGFYFGAFLAVSSKNRNNEIWGYCNCKRILLQTFQTGNDDNTHPIVKYYLNNNTNCPDWESQTCNYILIKGSVRVCNSSIAVPNISVILTRGGSAVTDADGNFTIVAYDDVLNAVRNDTLYFISNSCHFTDCNGECIGTIPITIQKCISCTDRVIDVGTFSVDFKTARGLLSGATYPMGVIGWDWLKRPTWVQNLGNITIPSVQDTQIFAPSRVRIDISPSAVFPNETTQLTFLIGDPTDIADYVTWIVDKVEFVDNTGAINDAAPTQIKIYYASLVEYNAQNNYNTTVNWQFIPTNETTPVTTDTVQFLLNGDGTFFPKTISALVKYDLTGQSFLINYTSDLQNLVQNAIIRLVRPKQCLTTAEYFEVCNGIVNIVNNHATVNSFYINAYDTYYINRQIPVPVGTTETPVNQIRIFGVPFESNSPSDFWGQGCHNIGRSSILNPDETVLYHSTEIALSGNLSETGLLNFLNYFDSKQKTSFDNTNIGEIVSILPETSIILVIGIIDHFLVGFNDNLARTDKNGNVVVPSADDAFGKPYNKVGSNYGCDLFDKNTIAKRQGIVKWVDTTESVLIEHDYRQAIPVSKNGFDGYLRAKIKAVDNYNLTNNNTRYFHGVINSINNDYLLTDFIIGSNSYTNHLREYDVSVQETISVGFSQKALKSWWTFTPEAYTIIDGDIEDMQLISFKNAIPYRHYTTLDNATFGTVYDERVNRIIRMVLSSIRIGRHPMQDNVKKKNMLSAAVYCKESSYFADQVITEVGQKSVIPLSYFNKAQYAWFAPFLCDLNTLLDPNRPLATGDNKLLDGDILYGTYVDVRFVGDPSKDTIFSEVQGFVINAVGDEPTGVVQK